MHCMLHSPFSMRNLRSGMYCSFLKDTNNQDEKVLHLSAVNGPSNTHITMKSKGDHFPRGATVVEMCVCLINRENLIGRIAAGNCFEIKLEFWVRRHVQKHTCICIYTKSRRKGCKSWNLGSITSPSAIFSHLRVNTLKTDRRDWSCGLQNFEIKSITRYHYPIQRNEGSNKILHQQLVYDFLMPLKQVKKFCPAIDQSNNIMSPSRGWHSVCDAWICPRVTGGVGHLKESVTFRSLPGDLGTSDQCLHHICSLLPALMMSTYVYHCWWHKEIRKSERIDYITTTFSSWLVWWICAFPPEHIAESWDYDEEMTRYACSYEDWSYRWWSSSNWLV